MFLFPFYSVNMVHYIDISYVELVFFFIPGKKSHLVMAYNPFFFWFGNVY